MSTLQEDLNELHRLKNEILKRLLEPILDFILEIKTAIIYRKIRMEWNKVMNKMQKRKVLP